VDTLYAERRVESIDKATRAAIEVVGLTKRFEAVQAVAGIDFQVGAGELFGFLGPNGAGKTTTINMLTGLARADAGTIRIGGIDCSTNPRAALKLIGVVPGLKICASVRPSAGFASKSARSGRASFYRSLV
jgi:ABC-type uncharacterized transport system ATPase subunit